MKNTCVIIQSDEINHTLNEEDQITLLCIHTIQSQPSQETHDVLKNVKLKI